MAKKKNYEFRESNKQFREHEGLKQRRLKDEARWKFNPNQSYQEDEDLLEEDLWDEENPR